MYINLILVDLPPKIRGLTKVNPDGGYTILLNSSLSYEMQQKTIQHELKHIESDDFYVLDDVSKIENKRHGL